MTSSAPHGPGAPDQDPLPSPPPPFSPGGAARQPPLVPYQPPSWADDAADATGAPDPYAPPAGPAGAGYPVAPSTASAPPVPPTWGAAGYGPYGAPGTPVYGSPPPAGPAVPDPSAGGYPPGYPAGYGQPGWPPAPAWNVSFAPPPRQNGLALASMITSLAGLAFCLLPGVVGLVLGIVALQQISRDGTTGRGFAIAGITVGAVETALVVLWFVAMLGTW